MQEEVEHLDKFFFRFCLLTLLDLDHLDMFLVSFFHLFLLNQGREAEGAEEATSHIEGGDVAARP